MYTIYKYRIIETVIVSETFKTKQRLCSVNSHSVHVLLEVIHVVC